MKFLVTQQEDSSFSFKLSDNDSNIVLSSLPFNNRDACINAVRGLTQALPNRANYEITSEDGQSFFNVISAGKIVGTSSIFSSFAEANDAADSLSTDTLDEPQYSVEVQTFSTSKANTARERVILPSLGEIDFASLYDLDHASPKGTLGFESFNRKDKNASYFHFNDADGQALLYSRGFDSNSKREKRIRQVIVASRKAQRYQIIEEGGRYYFIIKERNNLEIARSRTFATREEADLQVTFVKSNSPTYATAFPEPAKRKNVNQYNFDIKTNSKSVGFESVKGEDKQFYFVVKNANGNPILYSQGYGAATPRDNGIRTVIKNGVDESKYEKSDKNGAYSFILRARNRQEIAKSQSFVTATERDNALNWLVENTSAYAEQYGVTYDAKEIITENTETFTIDMPVPIVATEITELKQNLTTIQINSYLPCDSYAGHSDSPAEGIRTFSKDGMYYFSVLDKSGDVSMRSESYLTTAARDNGVASVLKNRDNKDRYAEIEEDGVYYVILKAGNHQEIARSCPSNTKIGLLGFLPLLGLAGLGGLGFVTASAAIPEVITAPPIAEIPKVAYPISDFPKEAMPITEVPKVTSPISDIPKEAIPITEVPKVAPTITEVPKVATPITEVPKVSPLAYAEPEAVAVAGGLPKWLLPLLGLALLGLLLWWLMKGCKNEMPAAVVETPVMADTAKVVEAAPASVAPVAVAAGEQMDGFAPIILYFDNDEPNKNSKAVSTSQTYTQAYNKYEGRKSKFSSEQDTPEAKTAILGFFNNEVKKGHDDLLVLADNIAKQLAEGHKANITVKGFASPLAQNEYNVNLTKRRISSIRNFLANHDGGKLKGLMDKISIIEQANGEDSAASGLNDDEKNTKLSIYDLAPSKERRVEIVDVRFVK